MSKPTNYAPGGTWSPNSQSQSLRDDITDICFKNGGVSKPLVDKLMSLIASRLEAELMMFTAEHDQPMRDEAIIIIKELLK